MRGLMLALRVAGGCWFWIFVLGALTGLLIDTNVATGRVSWTSRLGSAGLGLAFAAPGLVAWFFTGRWLRQRNVGPRGFQVFPPAGKRE